MDKDTYIKELEQALLDTTKCLQDVVTDKWGKWGWAWEEVIADALDLIERGKQI